MIARPVSDSEIHLEVWLASTGRWNRKFLGTGNGGYSGNMSNAVIQAALEQGYVKFGSGHPGKIIDWGYGAVHVYDGNRQTHRSRLLWPLRLVLLLLRVLVAHPAK